MAEEREIRIKDEYLQKILDICECRNKSNIKQLNFLIEEIMGLALKGLECDDKTAHYVCFESGKTLNILKEEI